ncbi:hypothetical protein [Sneathiella limimaris]|uniref:hypothetical protein n=1 Tax=Sneathiella limimaris TaxID=1964213 RepID=UPI00146D9606|nr:hypothetical protein [Sneathiella limimaris]
MTALTERLVRSKSLLAPPVKLEKAFDDPDGILKLIAKGSPYKTLAAVHRNKGETSGGWFRNFWALGEKVVFEGAEPFFYNQRFIDAAKYSFQAEIIRPVAMMTNLNLPAPGAPFHLDLPFFRGAQNREVPSWMLAPMGYSGLFHEWAIPVASAITWFYDGVGGEFEYWPEGLNAPSRTESPPYSNMCVLADNEYMYHRVGGIGPEDQQKTYENIGYDATLVLTDENRWNVVEDEKVTADFAYGDVRISVLWKGYCFKNEREAASYDDHSHDLTPELVANIFSADLKRRGIAHMTPGDFVTDMDWKKVITETYSAPDGGASY